jgi:protein associated with RNAse G/E
MQLDQTRASLLAKTLKCTDREQEMASLNKQVHNLKADFKALDYEKRDLDSLVIKVSQELKAKELDIQEYNFKMSKEKEYLHR